MLPVSVVILEIEHGCCGDYVGDFCGSSCGSSGCESKSSISKLPISTVMSRVNYLGVSGHQALYNPAKKIPDQSPHADTLRYLHVFQL